MSSLAPYDWAASTYQSVTVGASGAVYGLLMAWALLFPYREILFMFIFPLQARMFVLIVGAIAFLSAVGSSGTGVSNLAHLGGLLAAWLYLKGPGDLPSGDPVPADQVANGPHAQEVQRPPRRAGR